MRDLLLLITSEYWKLYIFQKDKTVGPTGGSPWLKNGKTLVFSGKTKALSKKQTAVAEEKTNWIRRTTTNCFKVIRVCVHAIEMVNGISNDNEEKKSDNQVADPSKSWPRPRWPLFSCRWQQLPSSTRTETEKPANTTSARPTIDWTWSFCQRRLPEPEATP